MPLPGGDQDRQRPPTALNAQVQLAAQPAAAAPQGLILRRSTSPLRFEVAWDHIQASIEGGLESCTRPLAYALPQCTPEEIHRLDRSVPRTFFSALLDRTVTQEELRHELLSLIQGWPATVGKQAPAKHLKVITDAGT